MNELYYQVCIDERTRAVERFSREEQLLASLPTDDRPRHGIGRIFGGWRRLAACIGKKTPALAVEQKGLNHAEG